MAPNSASDWDFYFCNVNDALSSIFVDLGAIRRAPVAEKPWLLWIWVGLRSPREDGLSSNDEAPKLYEIEDALTGGLLGQTGAELLGRITGSNRREFYFYAPDDQILGAAMSQVRLEFPDYEFEFGAQGDPEWRQYLDLLYPSEDNMQRIQNRRVLTELEEKGDDHSIPRSIDHCLYFRSAEDRRAFVASIAGAGFTVQSEDEDDDVEGVRERPYSLILVRVDPVTPDHLNQVTLQLFEHARQFGAEYDGWGCEVRSVS